MSCLELPQCFSSNHAGGVTSRAVSGKGRLSLAVQNSFGHDGTGRVAGAQKQDVVTALHRCSSVAATGTTARLLLLALYCSNESAHQFAVDLYGDCVHVDAQTVKQLARILNARNSGRI